ncbi:MAG: hypothetical protein A2X86_05820 [Bdellovibrionales bacterium GWA2_49_15]|nr:MAG: hypothetical protein A2X86_05820 [Bdellovibrionales bacterium GWA2_49_15]
MKTFRDILRCCILPNVFLYISLSNATTFLPTPLEQQLESVSAVIRGQYLGSVSKRSPSGDVVTQLSFKLKSQVGLLPKEILNPNNFMVLMPGGTLDGIVYFVQGVPTFRMDEEAIIFLAKGPYGLHIYNLGLGKYSIVKEAGNTLIRSDIFPTHSELGNISFEQLETQLSRRFGQSLQQIKLNYSTPPAIVASEQSRRDPASATGREIASAEAEGDGLGQGWILMLFLGILGIISTRLTRRRN